MASPVGQNSHFSGQPKLLGEMSSKPCFPWRQGLFLYSVSQKPTTTPGWINSASGRTELQDSGTHTGNTDEAASVHQQQHSCPVTGLLALMFNNK